jgi:hypothetical protein
MTNTITQSATGAVFLGYSEIRAPNLVLSDCIFDGAGGQYAVRDSWHQGTVFHRCIFRNAKKLALARHARFEVCTFDLQSFAGSEDCLFADFEAATGQAGIVVTDCVFLGRESYSPGFHADGFQIAGGSNVIVRDSDFYMEGANACCFIESKFADIWGVYLIDNTFRGGNYCVYVKQDENPNEGVGPPTNIVLQGNAYQGYEFGKFFIGEGAQVYGSDLT